MSTRSRDKNLVLHAVVCCVRAVRDWLMSAPVTSNVRVERVKGFC